jgi:5-methylcytosine-specific restriction protein A
MSAQRSWKAWYKTARWQKLRLEVFLRDYYTFASVAAAKSRAIRRSSSATTRSRIVANERLFWDEGNLQTMRKPCHDGAKQRAEQHSLNHRGVWY